MSKTVTTDEMCKHLGVDRITLQRAVTDGCPVVRRGKGRRPSRYNLAKVSAWFISHGKNPKGIEGGTLRAAVAPLAATPSDSQSEIKPDELIKQYGMMGYLERVRRQERYMNGRFFNAAQNGDPATDIANLSRALTIKGEELRRAEIVALEYQKQTGELCNLAEMQRLFVDLASGVRERVTSLPNELAPVLREYLRDPDDVGKVHDEIRDAIAHALAALPEVLPERKE